MIGQFLYLPSFSLCLVCEETKKNSRNRAAILFPAVFVFKNQETQKEVGELYMSSIVKISRFNTLISFFVFLLFLMNQTET